jgi:prepilin-type processing-associated H-X9-DG protein
MPIPFTCPHCGLQTNVADEYAGQSGPCARCGQTITVPPAGGAVSYAPAPKRSGGPAVLVIVILAVLGIAVVCGGVLVALMLPAVQAAREAARRAQCTNNMKQIALAMHNYHDTYNCFPPAYLADENGKPMHSWRVLLLPFLEQQALYEQYNFDEPWDSPANQRIAATVLDVYRCPSDPNPIAPQTCYVMIVGPETVSDGTKATSIREITDGTSNTILFIEATGSGIGWTEPRDLDATTITFQVNEPLGGEIESPHPGGANCAFCDGSVRFLSDFVDPEELRAMSTIAGGEAVNPL